MCLNLNFIQTKRVRNISVCRLLHASTLIIFVGQFLHIHNYIIFRNIQGSRTRLTFIYNHYVSDCPSFMAAVMTESRLTCTKCSLSVSSNFDNITTIIKYGANRVWSGKTTTKFVCVVFSDIFANGNYANNIIILIIILFLFGRLYNFNIVLRPLAP